MSKIATITLTFPHPDKDSDRTDLYRVEKITDSMRHAPLALLTRSEVEWLTSSKNYKVTISAQFACSDGQRSEFLSSHLTTSRSGVKTGAQA